MKHKLFEAIHHLSFDSMMKTILIVLVLVASSFATVPLYSHPHHIHADSGRGGYGPHHTNAPFPARLLQLCDGIVDHAHNSGPQAIGHKVFRVGAGITCAELTPSASVVVTSNTTAQPSD